MSNYIITKGRKDLDKSKYIIDVDNKIVTCNEGGVVLDFRDESGWSMHIGNNCVILTGDDFSVKVGEYCTLQLGTNCKLSGVNGCYFNATNNFLGYTREDSSFFPLY